MASKKYRGKLCVYCASRLSTGRDHVFAREFFLPGQAQALPQVPACAECNNTKSVLEHYLTALLPFGGRHADARETLANMVPSRLERNRKLHHHLAVRHHYTWSAEPTGLVVPVMAVPLDFKRVEALFGLIVKGLAWHHWKVQLTQNHFVTVLALSRHGETVFERKFFQANVRERVVMNLGNGAVQYEGVQGLDHPETTVWRFRMYGGATFGGDPEMPEQGSSMIGAMSGNRRMLTYGSLRAKFGP